MSKPRTLSPRMLEALVHVAASQKSGERTFLKDFRLNTVVALMSRGLMDTTDTGYVLTLSGEMHLITNGHMVMDNDIIIHVTTEYVSTLKKIQMVREYHLAKALEKFNTADEELVGKPLIRTVYDKLNNVGRLCNIRHNNDTENRCWEIVTAFDYVDRPTGGALYIVRYVGEDRFKFRHTAPYFLTDINHVINLY